MKLKLTTEQADALYDALCKHADQYIDNIKQANENIDESELNDVELEINIKVELK